MKILIGVLVTGPHPEVLRDSAGSLHKCIEWGERKEPSLSLCRPDQRQVELQHRDR